MNLAVEDKDVVALCRLGLTEYESRIYLALIKLGPRKASELSFFGHVPRTKAYGAIRELERKGLLRVIPGKPELDTPSSPSEFLMPLVAKA
jgi:sugar-specific transcriptional regulator TrmB